MPRYLFTVAALVRARQIFCPTAFNRSRPEISRALTSAATTANNTKVAVAACGCFNRRWNCPSEAVFGGSKMR